jgi:hypothetical protein
MSLWDRLAAWLDGPVPYRPKHRVDRGAVAIAALAAAALVLLAVAMVL